MYRVLKLLSLPLHRIRVTRGSSLLLLAFTASAGLLEAQLPIHLGIKAGGVWNRQEVGPSAIAKMVPATIGAYAELDLPVLPIIETGIFLKRYRYDEPTPANQLRANALEIPILLKKRFTPLPVQPFLAAGGTMRFIPSVTRNGLDLNVSTTRGFGLTAAAGVSIKALFLRIEPEFRATRWLRGDFLPQKNQVEFLVGLRF
jgi:hypothetical protein